MTVLARPLPDGLGLLSVDTSATGATRATGPSAAARYPTSVTDVAGQGVSQFRGISARQVDFISCAVDGEADSFVRLPTVEVVDEKNLDFLCHAENCIATLKRLE